MRKLISIILLLAVSLGPVSTGFAGDSAAGGLLLGAGSGALIGQAIGRDTEATLLGTAIGGVLGYIIGNEQEKVYAQAPVYTSYGYEGPVYNGAEGYYRSEYVPCREADILGTINGEQHRMRAVVCRDASGRWVIDRDREVVVVRRPRVIYRETPPVYYVQPPPVFNFSLGWIFRDGHHGFRRHDHGFRRHHNGFRPRSHGRRGGHRGRGGFRHR